jgi:hypothetical protein
MSRPRSARTVPLVTLLGVLLLAACGSPTPAAVAVAAAPDGSRHIEIAFAGGAVTGGVQRWSVPVNSTVELVVSSDVADEVHVHGYDRKSFVTAGATTTVEFAANLTGVFDVELEQRATPLASLQVN